MRKIIDGLDVLIRSVKTAVEAFIAIVGFQVAGFLADFEVWKSATVALAAGAVAAIWNGILLLVQKSKEGK